VRAYRRLAGAPTVETVDAVSEELRDRFGALPEPARNLVDIARIKAVAADHGITNVAVTRRRLTVSPVDLDDSQLGRAASLGAIHLERKKEIALPLGYGESVAQAALGLLGAIYSPESDQLSREE